MELTRRLAAALLLATLPSNVAWSKDGHERVARVAADILQGKPLDRIRTLLHGDLVDLAGWEEKMTKKFAETDALHWHRQEPEWTCGALGGGAASAPLRQIGDKAGRLVCDDRKGVKSDSLFCALAYFFEHFAHDALLSEFPAAVEPVQTPKKLEALRHLTSGDLAPSHYLRWLASLIGDLHQPLHWLGAKNYGKDLMVTFRGEEMTLQALWENYIPRRLPALALAKTRQKQYEDRSPQWADKLPTELFRQWAKEVAEIACTQIYMPMETNHADGSRTIESPFKVEEELFQKWVNLAYENTLLGGQRLAFVLQDILDHRQHKDLHKLGRGHHRFRRSWKSKLGTNLAIAAVVVPGLLLALQAHANAGGPDLFRAVRGHLKV